MFYLITFNLFCTEQTLFRNSRYINKNECFLSMFREFSPFIKHRIGKFIKLIYVGTKWKLSSLICTLTKKMCFEKTHVVKKYNRSFFGIKSKICTNYLFLHWFYRFPFLQQNLSVLNLCIIILSNHGESRLQNN